MNTQNIKDRIMQKVYDRAESEISRKAQTLVALLKYEIAVANTELAMRSHKHGYDFKFIPESYADSIVIGEAALENNAVTMTVRIPQHVLKDESESKIEFFKTYVLANAIKKLRNGT